MAPATAFPVSKHGLPDGKFEMLRHYDTVCFVDDSGSMTFTNGGKKTRSDIVSGLSLLCANVWVTMLFWT